MRDAKPVQAVSCQISRKAPNVQEQPPSTSSPSKHERTTDEGDNAKRQHNARVNGTVTKLRGGSRNWQRPLCPTGGKRSETSRQRENSSRAKSRTGDRRPAAPQIRDPGAPRRRAAIENPTRVSPCSEFLEIQGSTPPQKSS